MLYGPAIYITHIPHILRVIVICSYLLFSGMPSTAQEATGPISNEIDSAYIWKKIRRGNKLLIIQGANKDSVLWLFTAALKESKQILFYRGMVISALGLANYYNYTGDYQKALQHHEEAYMYCEQWGNGPCHGQVENNMAVTYTVMGDYEGALQHYLKALKHYESDTAVIAKASLYLNIGDLLLRTNRDSAALNYLEMAEQSAKKRNHLYLLGLVSVSKGVIYRHLGDEMKSKAFLLKAYDLARTYNFYMMQEQSLMQLSILNREGGHLEEALAYIEEGFKVNSIHHGNRLDLLLQKGLCHYALKDYRQAEAALLEAKSEILADKARIHTDRPVLGEIYEALAKTYRATGRYEQAIDYYEAYYVIKDSIFTKDFSGKINQLQENYETEKRNTELIKKELNLSQQQAIVQRKNILAYGLLSVSLLSGIFLVIYFNSRQRIQKQRNEIATWRASMEGEEKERTRLARQLHDSIGGSLSTVQMWFGTLQKRHREIEHSADYNEAMQLLGNTLSEVRETAHHLMPELLLRHGLTEAVRIYCNTVQKAGHLKIEYQYYGYIGQLNSSLELIIYRNIQELVQNVVKHAQASFALVQLTRHDDILSVTIEDNGAGMSEEQLKDPGMGLQNIKRSIDNMKGQFHIHSSKGNGCTVYFEINVAEQPF